MKKFTAANRAPEVQNIAQCDRPSCTCYARYFSSRLPCLDKTTGQSRKGKDVQTVEMNTAFDKAVQPVTGRTHEEMNVVRRRIKLSGQEQAECASLDAKLPTLETDAAGASGSTKARADIELYKARKRFFDLKC